MDKKNNFEKIGELIRSEKKEIIENWLEEVKKSIPRAKEETTPTLIDHLPDVLNNLADIFINESSINAENKLKKMSSGHGLQRALQTNFDLEEILIEYSILRIVILEKIYSNLLLTFETAQVLHDFIDRSNEAAVTEYVKIQRSKIQVNLEELNKEKIIRDRFVSAMTHDLRTPLAAAKMSAQIILRNPDSTDSVIKHILRIVSHLDRINKMIEDLLDASTIKAGHGLKLHMSECSLKEILEETVSDLVTIHGSRFELEVDSDFLAYWSPAGIKRVLENLCNNAVKYGSPIEPISIKAYSKSKIICIDIHNKGEPIPEEEVDKLFNPYQRASSAVASDKKGWGIGLTLVKGIVEAHGGTIKILTNINDGTTFHIELPLQPSQLEQ